MEADICVKDLQFQDVVKSLTEAANFCVYFTGRSTIKSTPHLYISSLATWGSESKLWRGWKKSFPGILSVKRTGNKGSTLLMMLNGHTSYVSSVAFSSDGTRIVSGSWDKSVRIWDASTGALLTMLNGHTSYVSSVAFSSDGTRIVSGSWDKSVCIWDASTGALLMMLNVHTDDVSSVAFSSDGTRIVSGSWDKSVRIWDASTGALLTMLNGHTDDVTSVTFSSDNTHIVFCPGDGSVLVSNMSIECPPVWDYTVHGQHWVSLASPEHWVIWLPYHKRLAHWVPTTSSDIIDPHALLVISCEMSSVINFTNSKMGPNWATCYSSSPPP